MYFYVFCSFDVFMHVFKMFYNDIKTCFYVFFYLQINVFNIYGAFDIGDVVWVKAVKGAPEIAKKENLSPFINKCCDTFS